MRIERWTVPSIHPRSRIIALSISEILGFPLDPLGLADRVGPVDHTTKLLHLIFYGADELVDGEVAEDAADVCIWKPIPALGLSCRAGRTAESGTRF